MEDWTEAFSFAIILSDPVILSDFIGAVIEHQLLSDLQTASLCRELSLLIHAGVRPGDGLTLLTQEEQDASLRELLADMAGQTDQGLSLSAAFRNSCRFPVYVTGLLEAGERTGCTEEALRALSDYYEHRDRSNRQIRHALTYPVILLLMLVVIVILLSRVLPVFDQVYASLGGRLTGVAGGLLLLGRWLDTAMPALCVLLAPVLILLAAFSLNDAFRARVLALWRRRRGDRGILRKLNDAHFAQALSLGLRSGLPMEEAVDLGANLLEEVPAAAERCRQCRERLAQGASLADALRDTGTLPAASCRLLALGLRSGSGDTVMEEIARRLSEEADEALERRVAQVEPALVLVTSLLVGAILLAVMLPLMHIMTAIG